MNRDKIGRFVSKSKFTLFGIVFISFAGFFGYTGYAVRPLVDEVILPVFSPKVIIAEKTLTDHEKAVLADMKTPEAQAYCKDYSEQRVSMNEARESVAKAQKAYQSAVAAEMRNSNREYDSIQDKGIIEVGMDLKSAKDNFSQQAMSK